MTPRRTRRITQLATALALAGAAVLVTSWAYPPGHLAIRVGSPFYSRTVGTTDTYVTIDIALKNVGVTPVTIDRERFLLEDDAGHRYHSDPSTHFLRNHFDVLTMPAGREIDGATIFRLPQGRSAARLWFLTATGEIVRFRLQ